MESLFLFCYILNPLPEISYRLPWELVAAITKKATSTAEQGKVVNDAKWKHILFVYLESSVWCLFPIFFCLVIVKKNIALSSTKNSVLCYNLTSFFFNNPTRAMAGSYLGQNAAEETSLPRWLRLYWIWSGSHTVPVQRRKFGTSGLWFTSWILGQE